MGVEPQLTSAGRLSPVPVQDEVEGGHGKPDRDANRGQLQAPVDLELDCPRAGDGKLYNQGARSDPKKYVEKRASKTSMEPRQRSPQAGKSQVGDHVADAVAQRKNGQA
ncbi:hypothetical protein PMKS-001091 [Pichia membranifaciens]|uniref:Uncharacterized protein n=1 Tax=Pichia membranifaciens TaxID=4926 RepID=A0A1Q2YE06_9ASCO|nr:hypothetical protein PMKS-001091 [Pichia membranifaciens]